MNDIIEQKITIRKNIALEIAKLTETEKAKESFGVCNKIINNNYLRQCKNICLYMATSNEVNLEFLFNYCLTHQIKIFIPRVEGNELAIVAYDPKNLKQGAWNIIEPIGKAVDNFENIDAVIVPLVAFDNMNRRLGHGKGFYDRFLSKLNASTLKIGVGFRVQQVPSVPTDLNDVKLDFIVCD